MSSGLPSVEKVKRHKRNSTVGAVSQDLGRGSLAKRGSLIIQDLEN